jgi:hypothetical protein
MSRTWGTKTVREIGTDKGLSECQAQRRKSQGRFDWRSCAALPPKAILASEPTGFRVRAPRRRVSVCGLFVCCAAFEALRVD